jgi:hypothetical protein
MADVFPPPKQRPALLEPITPPPLARGVES